MHIVIYFNNKPLFLCDEVDATVNEYLHHEDAVFFDELSPAAIKSMISEMALAKIHAGIYYHPDLEALKKAFFKKFTRIEAAGALVWNEKDEALLIFRLGKWDLPKGKMEKKEDAEQCCLREVTEETGLVTLKTVKPLPSTFHTYHQDNQFILKETFWFVLSGNSKEPLTPQTEESIEKAVWVRRSALDEYLKNTYPSVVDVFKNAG